MDGPDGQPVDPASYSVDESTTSDGITTYTVTLKDADTTADGDQPSLVVISQTALPGTDIILPIPGDGTYTINATDDAGNSAEVSPLISIPILQALEPAATIPKTTKLPSGPSISLTTLTLAPMTPSPITATPSSPTSLESPGLTITLDYRQTTRRPSLLLRRRIHDNGRHHHLHRHPQRR